MGNMVFLFSFLPVYLSANANAPDEAGGFQAKTGVQFPFDWAISPNGSLEKGAAWEDGFIQGRRTSFPLPCRRKRERGLG